jgi:RimJ/RimL family protein N-acetyltransferase
MRRVPLTLADVDWPLRTERLLIRRCRPEDADAIFAYRSLPDVAEWTTTKPTDLEAWRARYHDDDVAAHMLTVERDGAIVGDLMVLVRDGWAQKEASAGAAGVEAELGWAIAPEHQGQGLATEAALALFELAFDRLGLRRVVAGTFTANQPSWRVMEKLGMRLEHESKADGLHRDHGWMDGREYALLADEWAARRGVTPG